MITFKKKSLNIMIHTIIVETPPLDKTANRLNRFECRPAII